MSYKKGDLKVTTPPCAEAIKEHKEYDFPVQYCVHCDSTHSFYGGVEDPAVALPHSCDEWVIGGPDEIKTLIKDLELALLKFAMRDMKKYEKGGQVDSSADND